MKEYTTEFKKIDIMLGISSKNPNVLLKYLGGLRTHIQRHVMVFNPRSIDESYVQALYLENIVQKKGKESSSK